MGGMKLEGLVSVPGRVGARARSSFAARSRGALVGASDHVTTKSLYARDPDGIEMEICWILPLDVVTDELRAEAAADPRPRPLDLAAEKARYGATTRGGIGVSIPGVTTV